MAWVTVIFTIGGYDPTMILHVDPPADIVVPGQEGQSILQEDVDLQKELRKLTATAYDKVAKQNPGDTFYDEIEIEFVFHGKIDPFIINC